MIHLQKWDAMYSSFESGCMLSYSASVQNNGMPGETDLSILLKSMKPMLHDQDYVFCSIDHQNTSYLTFNPICMFREDEGLTLIVSRESADANHIPYSSTFRMITLSVHSSLEAVGFLATITSRLAMHGISVNPISAYYHDHLFIPASRADQVMELLQMLSAE